MPVHKRRRRNQVDWYYKFDLPGATRNSQKIIRAFGFATRQAAVEAEANRRIDEQKKLEMVKAGAGVDAPIPKTLAMLLDEFFRQHASQTLAPKTVERYKEQAKYLSPELLAKPIGEITALHLNREWARLLKSRPHPQNQVAAPLEWEDGSQYRRGRIERIQPRDQVGAGYHQSGHQLRAAQG
jgi:hypothetical protein